MPPGVRAPRAFRDAGDLAHDPVVVLREARRLLDSLEPAARRAREVALVRPAPVVRLDEALGGHRHEVRRAPGVVAQDLAVGRRLRERRPRRPEVRVDAGRGAVEMEAHGAGPAAVAEAPEPAVPLVGRREAELAADERGRRRRERERHPEGAPAALDERDLAAVVELRGAEPLLGRGRRARRLRRREVRGERRHAQARGAVPGRLHCCASFPTVAIWRSWMFTSSFQ